MGTDKPVTPEMLDDLETWSIDPHDIGVLVRAYRRLAGIPPLVEEPPDELTERGHQ